MEGRTARLALYRKYRSQDFDQLIGQTHITSTLQNALKNGRISHAYLFAGQRGVGKTSTARILAARINKLTPEQAQGHLDIIEIDAASNRRIDEMRDLRQKVHVAPTSARYKVYIIDEAHMLTNEAFNALLKTLEEPPEHAIFILATTEPHKLPETISSRTQRFSFQPVNALVLGDHLQTVAKAEKIKIDNEAVELIAMAADGSVRDGLSLLDQAANLADGQTVLASRVSELLGLAPKSALIELTSRLGNGDIKAVVELLDDWYRSGIGIQQLVAQLLALWGQLLRIKLGAETTKSTELHKLSQQLSLVRLTSYVKYLTELPPQSPHLGAALEASLIKLALSNFAKSTETPMQVEAPIKSAPDTAVKKAIVPSKTAFSETGWVKAITAIKTSHNSLYALIRSAETSFEEGTLLLRFRFQFHRRRIEEGKNLEVLSAALEKVFGQAIPIKTELISVPVNKQPTADDKAAVDSVLEIFGGEVVNESRTD